jgi:uncharacterized OB-fold protein
MSDDTKMFECAYCGALKRSRIVPDKCEKCGHAAFFIFNPNRLDETPKNNDKGDE